MTTNTNTSAALTPIQLLANEYEKLADLARFHVVAQKSPSNASHSIGLVGSGLQVALHFSDHELPTLVAADLANNPVMNEQVDLEDFKKSLDDLANHYATTVAISFSGRLADELGEPVLAQVDSLNKTSGMVCHAHDHCDANQVLIDAIDELVEYLNRAHKTKAFDQIGIGEGASDALFSSAYDYARKHGFCILAALRDQEHVINADHSSRDLER
ncbi:hypothetical protein ACQU0X_25615 [Pseudovibrio ascidiaceicola]|uniref:hypothetical protein n=1 Tax=Pseudovibrio ascidiaceicola TaxID=285279 RepID=UPI003D3643D7